MKKFTDIFAEYKALLLVAITAEVKARGGVMPLNAIIGGKDSIGFDRQTILDRVTMQSSLFDGEELYVWLHDKKFPNNRIEKPLKEFSMDVIDTICWAMDLQKGEKK